ncbi:MAG: hypothetical protein P8P83_00540 [Rickettsiaceae bacterium]|nr:hypothetical protein [Rickettsiaceae bacterium]
MIEKYTNAVSDSLYYVNKGVNIAATIINPTPIKITRQSFDLIKAIVKGETTQSTEFSHSQLVEGIASDADEQIKLMEFIKQNAAFGDSSINIETLPEKIQQLDNENKALIGVIKDESFSKYDPQGQALSNEQLKEKYINNLTEAKKNSIPPVKETRFQASKAVAKEFLYGVIGAFNPYNTYIHAVTDPIKPKEELKRYASDDIEVKLGTNDSGATLQEARESLRSSANTLTKDLQDIRNEQSEQKKKAEKKAKKRSIWAGVKSIKQALEYVIYKVESSIDKLLYPDGHATEKLRASDFTRMARLEEKEGSVHSPHSLGNALIDLPVKPLDNKKKEENVEAHVETEILNSSTLAPKKNTFNKLSRKNITKPIKGKKKEGKTNRNNWKDSIQDQRTMNTRERQKGG